MRLWAIAVAAASLSSGAGSIDVIAPHDQPLVPRAHHAHQAEPDPADIGPGLEHPVQDAGPVRHLGAEIGREDDVHRAGDVHLPLGGQVHVAGDLAAATVGADQVLGHDRVLGARDAVANADLDMVVVLGQPQVLGVEADPRAALGGVADQDRLQQRLGQVAVRAGAGQRVVGLPRRMGAPGAHAPDLIARQAGAEHGVPHQVLRGPVGRDVVLDPQVAEDLHGALVGDVGAGGVRRPAVLGDHDVLDAERGQRQRGGRARRPCAHDEHVGVDRVAHRLAPLVGPKPFTAGAHRAIVDSAGAPPDNRRCAD